MFVTADETLRIFMPKPSTPLFAGMPYPRLAWTHDLTSLCSQRLGAVMGSCPCATGGESAGQGEHRPRDSMNP